MRYILISLLFSLAACSSSRYSRYLDVDSDPGKPQNVMGAVNVVREYYEDAISARLVDLPLDKKISCDYLAPTIFDDSVKVRFEKQNSGRVIFTVQKQKGAPILADGLQPWVREVAGNLVGLNPDGKAAAYVRKTPENRILIEAVRSDETGIRPALSDPKLSALWYMDCRL